MKRALLVVSLVLLVGSWPAASQSERGRIFGTVTDPAGAVIPNAKVVVTNTATRISRETATDTEGSYLVLELPIGPYQLTAEAAGFAKALTEEYRLQINQSLRVNLQLKVGAVTETVQVEAVASSVETVVPTLGQSVTARPLVNMPLNGRNMFNLALLQPGVIEQRPGGGPTTSDFSIAGMRTDSVTFLIDGGLNNNLLSNSVVFRPNPDTVQEFRLLTSNYTAEFGRNAGGVVSVVTKSGTNEFHGSVFDFVRNEAFNASTFFDNRNGLAKPILKRHQLGGTVGGPILLPGVRGRDRFFFFVGYQGQRQTEVVRQGEITTFTPAEIRGDFSQSNAAGTGPHAGVASFLQRFPFFQSNAALAAQGIIDPNRLNSVARAYIAANLVPTSPTGRLLPRGPGKNDFDELTEKLDIMLTPSDRLAVTLGEGRNPILRPFHSTISPTGFPDLGKNLRYFGNVGYTKVFSPQVLNDFRFVAQRLNGFQAVPAVQAPKPNELGVNIISDNPTGPPRIFLASGMRLGFSNQGPTNLVNNTYIWQDTLSWTRGRHTWKFGVYFSPYQNNTVYDFYVNGEFFFSGPVASGGVGSGNDRADFLLGLPDEYVQFPEAPSDIRTRSYHWFVQDEWRVRRNLVLTLGLRYEYNQPKFDQQGRSFSLKLGQQSTVFTRAPLGMLFPGDANAPQGANFSDKNDWSPRFGFAWDPRGNGHTSLRGGFGVFYDILKGEDNLQFNGQAPFFGFTDIFFDELARNPAGEVRYLNDPFTSTGTPNPFPSTRPPQNLDFAAAGFLPIGGTGVYFVNQRLRTPYVYQYNFSIQHRLTRQLTAEVNYVGNSGRKMTALSDANPFVLGTTTRRYDAQPGVRAGSFSFLDSFENAANQSYNSLQASLTKRVSDTRFFGATYFTLAYTYGHLIDTASGFRERNSRVPAYNPKQFRADSDEDIRQRIVFSGGWDLPFDRRWKNRLTGGWSVYPILTWRTGFPYDVLAQLSRTRTRTGPSGAGDPNLVRANLVGSSVALFDPRQSQTFANRAGNYYFAPANFSAAQFTTAFDTTARNDPAQRTYGTFPRNAVRGPGRGNMDFAVAKVTNLAGERVKADFRAEFFNLLNNPQFREPNLTITSGSFGQVTQTFDARIIQFALRFTF